MASLEDKLLFQVLVCQNSEDSTYSVIAVVNSDGIEGRPGRGWVCGTKTREIGMQACKNLL